MIQQQHLKPTNALIQPGKTFRFNRTNGFLTYPNFIGDFDLDKFHNFLIKLLEKSDIKYLITCLEYHADGRPHFHAFFITHKKIDVKRANYFDYLDNHPKIEKPRSQDGCKSYCQKTGGANIRETGKYHTKEELRREKNLDLTKHIMDVGLLKAATESGALSLLNVPIIHRSVTILKTLDSQNNFSNRPNLPSIQYRFNLEAKVIGQTSRKVDLNFVFPQRSKQRHIFLVGQTNCYKSSFLNMLLKDYRAIRGSYYRNWTSYKEDCQFIIFDEFNSQISWGELFQICDSSQQLNIKGSNIDLDPDKHHHTVIIGTNYRPEVLFSNLEHPDIVEQAFRVRFNCVFLFNAKPQLEAKWQWNPECFGPVI